MTDMKKNKIGNYLFLWMCLFVWQACDTNDKGNYNYTPLNGVEITFAREEENQQLEKGMDTLRIQPTIAGDLYGENEENYEYTWFFCSGKEHRHTVVGKGRDLEWPVSFKPGNYTLYLQVDDRSTGLQWIKSTNVNVFSELTEGWMLLGETEDGEVRMDMLVQKPDTVVLVENIFDNSELHLKNPRDLIFTGYRYGKEELVQLWLTTEDQDWRLTWGNNFLPIGEFHKVMTVEETEVSRKTPRLRDLFPRQCSYYGSAVMSMRNDSNRGIVTDSAIYMTTMGYDGSEAYVNPMNRYNANSNEFFKPYPMAFVMLGANYLGNLHPLFYDMDEDCFVQPGATYGTNATYCKKLADYGRDPFPWNQNGRRTIVYGENLRNTTSDYTCNCVALMKDTEGEAPNYYIYVFRPGGKGYLGTALNPPTKVAGYTVNKAVAVDFDRATHYTFMSNANVLLYTVGSTLYAYNYSYNTMTSLELGNPVSYLSADAYLDNNCCWVGTYDEGTRQTELKIVQLSGYQTPALAYEEKDCWQLNMKLVRIEGKYGDDPAEEDDEEEGN